MAVPLGKTSLIGSATLLVAAAAAGWEREGAERVPAWSAQLHLHGSFSEGLGSIDSHSWEASDVGADVIWWSDHDFRITSLRALSTFGFEGSNEARARGESWNADTLDEIRGDHWRRDGKWLFELRDNAGKDGSWELVEDAVEGERSVRITAANPSPDLSPYVLGLASGGAGFARPLAAGVRIELAVKPQELTSSAHPLVRVELSEHAPRGDVGLELYALEYALVAEPGEPRLEGPTYRMELAVHPGEWNRLVLPISEDAARGFPFLVPGDDSLTNLQLGVETHEGARATVQFDDLSIDHRRPGAEMFERQRELIAEVAQSYPGLVQLQGVEISYLSLHVNEFSLEPEIFDYEQVASGLEQDTPADRSEGARRELAGRIGRRAVAGVHARGGLVSYNHMFGASWSGRGQKDKRRDEVLEELRSSGVLGADLLEVGYSARGGHDLSDHLWVWDQLALAGLPVVGTGVSDSHGGPKGRWRTADNNFVSWIYAPEPTRAHLIDGLRAGRVFFGDLTQFDGRADLVTERGFAMGQVVWTDREQVAVELQLEGAKSRDVVRVVRSGERIDTLSVSADGGLRERIELALSPESPTTIRCEVEFRRTPKLLTNPITFVRGALPRPVAGPRAGLDLGGAFALRLAGLDLELARTGDGELLLRGVGRGGPVHIDCAGMGSVAGVELEGLGGSARVEGTLVILSELSGQGVVRIRAGP